MAAIVVLTVLFEGSTVAQGRSDAERLWESDAYQLRVDLPQSWSFVEHPGQLLAGALVGATTTSGTYAVILSERMPGTDLSGYAALLRTTIEMDNLVYTRDETVQAFGREAHRYEFSGSIAGIDLGYAATLFRNGDHYFQVRCWSRDPERVVPTCKQFERAVTVGDGVVTGAPFDLTQVDQEGAGWTLRSDRFVSPPYGLSITPPEGWQVSVHDELAAMGGDSAAAGMVSPEHEAYLLVYSEPTGGNFTNEDLAQRKVEMLEAFGVGEDRSQIVVRPFGVETMADIAPLDFEGISFKLVIASVVVRERLFLAAGWYPDGTEGAAAVAQAMAALQPAPPDAVAPASSVVVGENFSLSDGIYRDFRHAITWEHAGDCWLAQAPIGSAREFAALTLTNPCNGLVASLAIESNSALSPEESILELAEGSKERKQTKETLQHIEVEDTHYTSALVASEFDDPSYVAIRPLADKAVLRAMADGGPDVLLEHRDELDALVGSVVQHGSLPMMRYKRGLYEDLRLRFSLQGPSGWQFEPNADPEARSFGSVVLWTSGKKALTAMALWSVTGANLSELMEQHVRRQLVGSDDQYPDAPTESVTTLGSGENQLTARKLVWVGRTETTQALFAESRGIYFMLMASWPGSSKAPWFAEAVSSFQIQ